VCIGRLGSQCHCANAEAAPIDRRRAQADHERTDQRCRISEAFKELLVDLVVSDKTLDTALETANELFQELERAGLRLALAPLRLTLCLCGAVPSELSGPMKMQFNAMARCRRMVRQTVTCARP
jgi:hypothetical protein